MKKQRKSPPRREGEEKIPETSTAATHIYDLSDKEFRGEILRRVDVLQATMEQTSNKLREHVNEALEQSTKKCRKK